MAEAKLCSVEGCGKPSQKRSFCNAHYLRWWRHGDPLLGSTAKREARDYVLRCAEATGDECLLWPYAKTGHGRGMINRRGKSIIVAREVCRLAHGEPPAAHFQAAHSCGKGHLGCVNPRHLRWATPSENAMDKVGHGTHNRGERNGCSKLTLAQVREIRQFDPRKTTFAALARKHGVRRETIRDIVNRRTWAWA